MLFVLAWCGVFFCLQAQEALRHPYLREYPPPKRIEDMPPCPFVAYGPGEVPPGVGGGGVGRVGPAGVIR
jgi:hypothetical protein